MEKYEIKFTLNVNGFRKLLPRELLFRQRLWRTQLKFNYSRIRRINFDCYKSKGNAKNKFSLSGTFLLLSNESKKETNA